jgi:hypothetical protein
MRALAILIIVAWPKLACAAADDRSVCDVLSQLPVESGKDLQVVGELYGNFYHGFGLFGRAHRQPCSGGEAKWFRSPSDVGLILVNFVSQDGSVPRVLVDMEDVLKRRCVRVRVVGALKAKVPFFSICLGRGSCISNGFLGDLPAMLLPRSIEVLNPDVSKATKGAGAR